MWLSLSKTPTYWKEVYPVQRCFTRRLSDLHKLIRCHQGFGTRDFFSKSKNPFSDSTTWHDSNVKLASREAKMSFSTILPVLFLPKKHQCSVVSVEKNVGHIFTLPKTTTVSHLKMGLPKRKQSYSNHPFSGAMSVSFRGCITVWSFLFKGIFPLFFHENFL